MINFLYPWLFLLMFLPFIVKALWSVKKQNLGSALRVPFVKDLENIGNAKGEGISTVGSSFWPIFVVWALLVFGLMRPVMIGEPIRLRSESRNMVLIMDISPSMLERDFVYKARRIDRLSGVKNLATEFVSRRGNDKLGLVLFATRAYLQSPITYDKQSIIKFLQQMDAGMAGESTSIGDALGLGLKYLKDEPNKDKKVMILLTDGESNDGFLSVAQATKMAIDEGVKIYTIGVGSQENFMNAIFGSQGFDEKSLKEIAKLTQGRYFKATSGNDLFKIYQEIDKLEPIENEANTVVKVEELFYVPALVALLLICALLVLYRRRA